MTRDITNSVKPLKKNTQVLCFIKIILIAVLILLMFLPGMFNLTHDHANHVLGQTWGTDIIPISFAEYSLANTVWFDLGNQIEEVEVAIVLFYIIVTFIVVELAFSIIRAAKPNFAQKGKWQLIIPILIFVLFIATSIWHNFDSSYGMKTYEYELLYTDEITGEVSQSTLNWKQSLFDQGLQPFDENIYRVIGLKTYTNTLNFSFIFYIEIALFVTILSTDFYVILSNSFNENKQFVNENLSSQPISTPQNISGEFCVHCGTKLKQKNLFCPKCGTKRKIN